jgi:hypothetical protein
MSALVIPRPAALTPPILADDFALPLRTALAMLSRASKYARDTGTDIWQFAEELAGLRAAGITHADLRWLLRHGIAVHAAELRGTTTAARQFRDLHTLALPENTCFILTERGEQLARQVAVRPFVLPASSREHDPNVIPELPRWCASRRSLWLGKKLVKAFRCPAPNQQTVLSVFQEAGWPRRIDDPLTRLPQRDRALCLHYTIHHLNRNQVHRLIHFRGDGTGEGVCWAPAEAVCVNKRQVAGE